MKRVVVENRDYIIAALSAVVVFLKVLNMVDPETAATLLSILLTLLGVSVARQGTVLRARMRK